MRKMFEDIALKNIKRNGIQDLLVKIGNSDFYTAPASTKYHDSYEGGLVKHSIEVYKELCLQNELLRHEYSRETITIVSLFHDLCKIGFYKSEMRNTKNEHGKWIQVPYYTVDDLFPYGHGEKSVYLINQAMTLTDEEAIAIRWHMGGWESKENHMTMSRAFNDSPLALILSISDLKVSYIQN